MAADGEAGYGDVGCWDAELCVQVGVSFVLSCLDPALDKSQQALVTSWSCLLRSQCCARRKEVWMVA